MITHQEVVVEVLGGGDFRTHVYEHHHISRAWFPDGTGVTVITDALSTDYWLGEAQITVGRVTRNEDWPDGAIYREDILGKATVTDPTWLRWLLTHLAESAQPKETSQ
jgi:hypothetical protein